MADQDVLVELQLEREPACSLPGVTYALASPLANEKLPPIPIGLALGAERRRSQQQYRCGSHDIKACATRVASWSKVMIS